MNLEKLKEGIIIKSDNWLEPVEVKRVENQGSYIRIIGSTITSNDHIDQLLSLEDINSLQIEEVESKLDSPCINVFLAFEAKRFKYASLYDPLLAINISKVDPLPHQIEAVYGYVLQLPRIRFLIADDPGAGKTIMAGLILKELKLRNLIKRILIVVPGHLKDQWRRELKDRFKESFVVVDRAFINAHYGDNVWEKENQIITSMDFAKRDEIIPSISSTSFDLVIVDEAHKMSAFKYGEQTHKTRRYKLGEIISNISENLLFLTATPHRGDPENFRLFLDLLEPGFFATQEMLENSIKNKDNPLFIRRIKEDLKDFEGKPLFLPRNIQTIPLTLLEKEKILYNNVSKYVREQYNKALARDGRRYIAFALVILQRRLASSTYALLKSLERRKEKLEKLLEMSEQDTINKVKIFDFEDIEDLSEEERWKEEEIWETLSVAENREELKKEIQTLENLIEHAVDVIQSEEEKKLLELKKTLKKLEEKFPNEKVIIFTESRDTLDYLKKKLISWGYNVNVIHGGMPLESRIEAESVFKNLTQILIATEAAGEGINLQFCHLMINYDIPWNPNRLEQRMGRIHRYGQNKEVFIFNLVAIDTREGKVLNRLFEKLQEIRDALGSDKVFDVINEVVYGKNLSQLLLEAAACARDIEQIIEEIDIEIDEEYIQNIKERLGESLATKFIDYTRIKEMAEKAKEFKLIPEYTEAFFKKAFSLLNGKIKERKDGFLNIEKIPYELRSIADEEPFKRKYGNLLKRYPKVTFDKDIAFKNPDAEFISFDHPLFESLLEYINRNFNSDLRNGTIFIDPSGKLDGYILFYEGEIKDGLGRTVGKKLFTIFTNESEIKSISPTILWDLAEEKTLSSNPINIQSLKSRVIDHVISLMEDYKKEKLIERNKAAKIKEKYGIKSLQHLILKLDGDLITLYKRKENGEFVDLPIRNKKIQKERYENALKELREKIIRERTLTMSMPKFIGIIQVKPIKEISEIVKSTKEIELIGMKISMEYERKHGREPEDVSKDTSLGYDIRSIDNEGNKRYIEVKTRMEMGDIALTQNEWFKAKRFGDDYYLYVVLNAITNPKLYIIKNPASNLKPNEKLEIVRYIVPYNQIKEKGEKNG